MSEDLTAEVSTEFKNRSEVFISCVTFARTILSML